MQALNSRVFTNGNSQAVRIPAEFRLATNRVQVSRNEQGDLIIHPIMQGRGDALMQTLQSFDSDFISELEDAQSEALPMQEREGL